MAELSSAHRVQERRKGRNSIAWAAIAAGIIVALILISRSVSELNSVVDAAAFEDGLVDRDRGIFGRLITTVGVAFDMGVLQPYRLDPRIAQA